jgi:hypothetical protein
MFTLACWQLAWRLARIEFADALTRLGSPGFSTFAFKVLEHL